MDTNYDNLIKLAVIFPKNIQSRDLKRNKRKKEQPLVALVEKTSAYDGSLTPFGIATLRFNKDKTFLMHLNMNGLDPACDNGENKCAVSINDGDCDTIGDPLTNDMKWSTDTGAYYLTYGDGLTNSAFRFSNGYHSKNIKGNVVILQDTNSTVVACGVLQKKKSKVTLTASIGKYPEYEGPLNVTGKVKVTYNGDESFKFQYDLEGLEENCVDCGIHIHAGVSCDTHADVKGHGWNKFVVRDMWVTAGGTFYNTPNTTSAKGFFYLYNGFGIEETVNHAVVVHTNGGGRVGCGTLGY